MVLFIYLRQRNARFTFRQRDTPSPRHVHVSVRRAVYVTLRDVGRAWTFRCVERPCRQRDVSRERIRLVAFGDRLAFRSTQNLQELSRATLLFRL